MSTSNNTRDELVQFAALDRWMEISGMTRNATYSALARGDILGRKLGKRTIIDVQHGLKWLHSLPEAKISVPSLVTRKANKSVSAAQ